METESKLPIDPEVDRSTATVDAESLELADAKLVGKDPFGRYWFQMAGEEKRVFDPKSRQFYRAFEGLDGKSTLLRMFSPKETVKLRREIDIATNLAKAWRDCCAAGLHQRWETIAHCMRNPDAPAVIHVPLLFGARMLLDLREVVSQTIFMDRIFEPDLTLFMLTYLKPSDVFFDVGAHFGYFSLLANSILGGAGQIVAFEPSEHTYKHRLLTNCQDAPTIRTENVAVWNQNGEIQFHDYGLQYSAFNSFTAPRLSPSQRPHNDKIVKVRAVSLDEYCETTGILPTFVKLDVEGAELQVLKGMSGVLRRAKPGLSVEVGDITSGTTTTAETLAYLQDCDYELFECRKGRVMPHILSDTRYAYDNIIALPRTGDFRQRVLVGSETDLGVGEH